MEMLVLDNIKKRAHDRKDSTLPVSADQWKFTKLPNLFMKCCADVYNVDETSLFYCAMLHASLSYKCAAVSGSKKSSELCCAVQTCQKLINGS
jgi:hypothetical protein